MDSPRTRMYTHPFFEATPPGAAPGPPVKNRVPVFATSGGVKMMPNSNLEFPSPSVPRDQLTQNRITRLFSSKSPGTASRAPASPKAASHPCWIILGIRTPVGVSCPSGSKETANRAFLAISFLGRWSGWSALHRGECKKKIPLRLSPLSFFLLPS